MKQKHWYDYLWIWTILYFSLGFFNILFAWLGMIDFLVPLFIAIIGGNMEAPVDGAPGNYDMAYVENLPFNLIVPHTELANVTEAATMVHMMNANTFTAGVVKMADGTDMAAFADTMADALKNNQWMCGMPEHMIIADMGGNYMLIAFGVNDAMGPFEAHLAEAYAGVTPIYSESMI